MCNSAGTKLSSNLVLIQSGNEWCLDFDYAEANINVEFYCLAALSACESYLKYEFDDLHVINEYKFYNYTNLNCQLTGMSRINDINSYCENLQFYETLWIQNLNEFTQIASILKSTESYFLDSKNSFCFFISLT